MPTSRTDTRVECPFYQYDRCIPNRNIRRIVCEGIVDATTLALNYEKTKDFRMQIETFCCRYFDKCEVYRMLMQKYEEV